MAASAARAVSDVRITKAERRDDMTSKEYLKRLARQLEKLETMISNKIEEQAKWKAISLNITSHSDGQRVQSSGNKQKMADAIDRRIDIEREINTLIDQLYDTRRELLDVIEQLNVDEYDVLYKRYIQRMTFDEIGFAKGQSKSWTTTVHGRGIENVQRIIDRKTDE